ncbi:MAG: hypothetical protein EHM65_04895 [Acidobacteriales bacterium]|nr:MAG: hypothetical protein EHM65_04895 [Terriglobales bacterium]
MAAALARVAPGTELRDGLERIMRGRTGALIVLGHDKGIDALISGGFPLDIDFTSTRLRELCKMDGAVIIDSATSRIVRAGTQLVPDPTIPTGETGTRHRTADRVSKSSGSAMAMVSVESWRAKGRKRHCRMKRGESPSVSGEAGGGASMTASGIDS